MSGILFILALAAASSDPQGVATENSQAIRDGWVCKLRKNCQLADQTYAKLHEAGRMDTVMPAATSVSATGSKGIKSIKTAVQAGFIKQQTHGKIGHGPSRIANPKCGATPLNQANDADLMIAFTNGSAVLGCESQANLIAFASAISQPDLSGIRFRIDGHTSANGTPAYNLKLSQMRAQAVVDFLAHNGVKRDRLTPVGWGFDKPLKADASADANRRVEAVVMDAKK